MSRTNKTFVPAMKKLIHVRRILAVQWSAKIRTLINMSFPESYLGEKSCAMQHYPGVYSNVAYFKYWIEDQEKLFHMEYSKNNYLKQHFLQGTRFPSWWDCKCSTNATAVEELYPPFSLNKQNIFKHLGHCNLSVRSCCSIKWSTASRCEEVRNPQTWHA